MADISTELAIISTATYGEQVRTAICDALRKIDSGGSSGSFGGLIMGNPVSVARGFIVRPLVFAESESEE